MYAVIFDCVSDGLTIWRKGRRKVLAHISMSRKVKLQRYMRITPEEKSSIYAIALVEDPILSEITKVYAFKDPPVFLSNNDALEKAETVGHNRLKYRGQLYEWHDNAWINKNNVDKLKSK